ncbi:MAG: AMP-dependent synthetase/ligase [Sulfuricaulis sp.]|nr:AMP-dependent synthetase/ligase [Sulfuricaulis sp.]
MDNSQEAPASHDPGTVVGGFLRTVQEYPDIVAVRTVDGQTSLTWMQVRQRVASLAAGLRRLGVRHGDTVALMLKNRPEFMVADVAAMCLGAAPFSLYATLPVGQIVQVLQNSDARLVLCEREFLPQILGARSLWPNLEHVILLEGGGPVGTLDWAQVEVGVQGFDLETAVAAVRPEDLAALVYTSGTTGPAKGVELTHAGVVRVALTNNLDTQCSPSHRYLSWLPTAAMAERVVSHYMPLMLGGTVSYCADTKLVAEALSKVAPHIFFAPPRFWDKLKAAIQAQWAGLPQGQRAAIAQALEFGLEKVRLEQVGEPVPQTLRERCARADRELFASLRQRLGLGTDDVYTWSGGAAAPRHLLEFFAAIGVSLNEPYGLTESSALGTRNPRQQIRMGTVGKAQPGVEVMLADDGEILIRNPAIMRGYRKQPDATAAAKDAQGWLHTGDLGTVDADGYFRIVDRKKDMIINSFGKNMSPVNIEAALTTSGPFICQAVAIGEARNYNVALLTLDSEYVKDWAEKAGLPNAIDIEFLARDPRVRAQVEAEVKRANEQLARVEQIKKYHIVGGEWLPGSLELTPSMKLKRRVIASKYAADIDALYVETV